MNKRRIYFAVIFSCVLFFGFSAYSADDILNKKFLTGENQRQWDASRTKLAYDHGVCLEHCGGDKDCEAKCQKSYKSRLEMAFQSISHSSDEVGGQTDIITHPSCSYCGMDRAKFAHSRIYVLYDDNTSFGACSIHCAAVDLAINIDKSPISIMVGDFNTGELIDAEKAVWVIGGKKPGVMTARAKWAFETSETADAFIEQNGGEKVDFEAVMEASYDDMYSDTKMIREKRKKMRMMKK